LHDRTGRLIVPGVPASYAATTQNGKLILLFPFVFYNAGPVPYVVRDLRLRFRDEPDGPPLSFQRVRSGISPSHSNLKELSAAFPVRGNEAVRMFCEFERTPVGRAQLRPALEPEPDGGTVSVDRYVLIGQREHDAEHVDQRRAGNDRHGPSAAGLRGPQKLPAGQEQQ
jgi:hypothetical protein